MAYIDARTSKDRAASIGGVIAVHGALGCALLFGLTATGVIDTEPNLDAFDYTEVKVDPIPPAPPEDTVDETVPVDTYVYTPPTRIDIVSDKPVIDALDIPLPPIPEVNTNAIPPVENKPVGPAVQTFDLVAPRPNNDTSQWVTTADYRSSWINRELTGVARFRVEVGTNGRVSSCTVTGSSGHPQLDRATCDLVTRRARFEPGRDETGAVAQGTYSSAVSWRLPE